MLLSLQNVSLKSYNRNIETIFLDSINLDIKSGEAVGLIGETGSGKTMLAWTILDQLPISSPIISGKILFDNKETIHNRHELKGRDISMVFQNPMQSLNPIQTIGKQFSFILIKRFNITKEEALSKVRQWLSRVYLDTEEDILKRYPHQLSGGQMQRIMIAIAMSVKPKLLIADEVTTALDANLRKEILDLINELRTEEKVGTLLISHDLLLIKKHCDKTAVMKSGKIVEFSKTDLLFKKPKDRYSKSLIRSLDFIKSNNFYKESEKETLCSINNLFKSYISQGRKHNALKNINLDIYKNEILGIVGESGSGKSTLAKTLLQIIHQDQGEITLHMEDGSVMSHLKPNRLLSAVFQDSLGSLNPRMTIFEILMEPMIVLEDLDLTSRTKKLNDCIEKVELSADLLNRYPHMLSGGQRQQVSIARALMQDPSLLILDEPTSALDIKSQEIILDLLKSLIKDKKLTILLISHDIRIVMETVDRLAVLYKGEIIEEEDPYTIFNTPKQPYTKSLLGAEYNNS